MRSTVGRSRTTARPSLARRDRLSSCITERSVFFRRKLVILNVGSAVLTLSRHNPEQGVDHLLGDQRPFLSVDRVAADAARDTLNRVPVREHVAELVDRD